MSDARYGTCTIEIMLEKEYCVECDYFFNVNRVYLYINMYLFIIYTIPTVLLSKIITSSRRKKT